MQQLHRRVREAFREVRGLTHEHGDIVPPPGHPLDEDADVLLRAAPIAVGDGEQDSHAPLDLSPPTSLLASAFHGAAFFLLRAASAFVASAVYAREVGVEGRGRVAFGLTVAGVTALIFSVSCTTGMIRDAASARRSPSVGTALLAGGLCCVPAVSIVGLLGVLGIGAFGSLRGVELAVVIASIIPTILYTTVAQAMILADRLRDVSLSTLAGAVASLGVVIGWTSLGTPSPAQVLGALLLNWAVGLIWLVAGAGDHRHLWVGAWNGARPLVQGIGGLSAASVAVLLVWRVDVALVSGALGFTGAGLYASATSIAEVLLVSLMAVRPALQSRYARPDAELDGVAAQVVRLGLVIGGVAAASLIVLAPHLLRAAFGDDFTAAAPALRLLAPGVVLLALQFTLFDLLVAKGSRPAVVNVIGIGALSLVVVGDVFLLPGRTPVVAAGVSTVGYAVLFVGFLVALCRTSTVPLRQHLLLQPGDGRLIRDIVARVATRISPRTS